jgi:beta-glucanase (GH16 family)
MRLLRLVCLVTIAFSLQVLPTWANPPVGKQWLQTFQDEFDGSTLNRQKWATTYPNGRHTNVSNHEQQWYVDDALMVKDGHLYITATRQEKTIHPEYHYVSGLITSHDSFAQQYGYFETRAQIPKGEGMWPAFWMLPIHNQDFPENHDFPEIDILESFGTRTQQPYQTYFTWNKSAKTHKFMTITNTTTDLSEDFHTYGVYWTKDVIQWFIDDKPVAETKELVSHVPEYLLLNLALQADTVNHSNVANNIALNSGKPASYIIDYVRAYQEK